MIRITMVVAAVMALAACGKAGAGSTPEETYENMKAAMKSKDWKAMYGCMDPEKVDDALGMMAMGGTMMSMSKEDAKKELAAIFEKHKFTAPKDGQGDAKGALKGVSDKAGLFADLMGFMEKHSPENAGFRDKITGSTLKDVKIEGDNATAKSVSADGKDEQAMKFVRRTGRWYLSPE